MAHAIDETTESLENFKCLHWNSAVQWCCCFVGLHCNKEHDQSPDHECSCRDKWAELTQDALEEDSNDSTETLTYGNSTKPLMPCLCPMNRCHACKECYTGSSKYKRAPAATSSLAPKPTTPRKPPRGSRDRSDSFRRSMSPGPKTGAIAKTPDSKRSLRVSHLSPRTCRRKSRERSLESSMRNASYSSDSEGYSRDPQDVYATPSRKSRDTRVDPQKVWNRSPEPGIPSLNQFNDSKQEVMERLGKAIENIPDEFVRHCIITYKVNRECNNRVIEKQHFKNAKSREFNEPEDLRGSTYKQNCPLHSWVAVCKCHPRRAYDEEVKYWWMHYDLQKVDKKEAW